MDSTVGPSMRQLPKEDLVAAAAVLEAAAAKSTIEVTLGALVLGLDPTGGESLMRKGAEKDSGKISEMRWYAEDLWGDPAWKDLAPDLRAKLMQQRLKQVKYLFGKDAAARAVAVHKARLERLDFLRRVSRSNSSRKKPLKSQGAVRANAAEGGLKLAKRAQHAEEALAEAEEAVRAEETWAEAGGPARAEEALAEARGAVRDEVAWAEAGGPARAEEALAEARGPAGAVRAEEALAEARGAVRDEVAWAEAGGAVRAQEALNSEGSYSFTQEESVNELEMRLEMMEIRPEMQATLEKDDFHKAILTAMLNIKEKLAKKKTDEDNLLLLLLLLNSMSNRLDKVGSYEKNEIDKGKSAIEALLVTNEGTDMTMVESDIKPASDPSATNSMTFQAETLPQLVKDFSDSMRSEPAIQEHMPMVGSDKLLIHPADPSSTDSVNRLAPYFLQDDLDHDETSGEEMTDEESDEEMTDEEKKFADYRESWEALWSKTCGSFEHMTALSSMQFTYYTPGRNPPSSGATTPETLQIFSIKLTEIPADLGWPLSVYGVVAVRDVVDHNRNFLFYCDRNNSQELTQNDPFLRLIGPSRAVVFADMVHFEIELEVKGTTRSQDKALITEGSKCRQIYGGDASTICFENCFCKIEFCVQLVRRTTQATILGVQVVNGGQWPFKYGARVACSSLPGKIIVTKDNRVNHVTDPASGELVMVDSKDGAKLKGARGYLHLTRSVVSVEDQGRLDIDIQAYSESGGIAARRVVSFPAKFSKISTRHCFFGNVKLLITVAWSLVATDKLDVMSDAALV